VQLNKQKNVCGVKDKMTRNVGAIVDDEDGSEESTFMERAGEGLGSAAMWLCMKSSDAYQALRSSIKKGGRNFLCILEIMILGLSDIMANQTEGRESRIIAYRKVLEQPSGAYRDCIPSDIDWENLQI